jgi:hypothetical protein
MTTFSAAAAAALECPDDTLKPGIYSYAVELELTVKTNGQFAPSLVIKILAKLLLDEPDIAFVDSKGQRITVDEFPTSKTDFDDVFSTTTTGGRLSCQFEIQSFRHSFHAIKIGAWDVLHDNKVWFKRAPGPVKKTALVAIGFWMNLHPGFASPRVFHSEIAQDLATQYEQHHDVIQKFKLPAKFTAVELYLSRRKIQAQYPQNGTNQPISTDALMTYANKEHAEMAIIQLTHMSSFRKAVSGTDPMFIPLAAKYHTPAKFGQCVVRHNTFLNGHRNITLVGIHPDAMDAATKNGQTLWTTLRTRPSVYRCDPCRRTPDLGKWSISSSKTQHPEICEWLDENLVPMWEALPNRLSLPPMKPFTSPERLSKGRLVSSGSSVTSGLTDASPLEDYFRTLEANLPLTNMPSPVYHNAWDKAPPVEDITYSFNVQAFPKIPTSETTHQSTTTTTQSTSNIAGNNGSIATESIINTSVSAITESLVTETIKIGIEAYQHSRKLEDDAFAARMLNLEQQVGSITEQVAEMANTIQTAIIDTLTGEHGIISQQNSKFSQLASVVDRLADSIAAVLACDRERERDVDEPNPTPPRNRKKTKHQDGLTTPTAPSADVIMKVTPPIVAITNISPHRTCGSVMNFAPPEPPDPSLQ